MPPAHGGYFRPASLGSGSTLRSDIIVLDVGATIGADAEQLVDFSILGAALARAIFDMETPTVGLLNVGVEDAKGNEWVKDAAKSLSETSGAGFKYHGFVEGDDLGKGTVDVVVTEGFTGNIALKTAEGTARQVATYLRNALKANFLSRLGAMLAWQALSALKSKMDPRTVNGGVFLGLNGVVIKSHGGTDEIGYKSALGLAYDYGPQRSDRKDRRRARAHEAGRRPGPTGRIGGTLSVTKIQSVVRGVGGYLRSSVSFPMTSFQRPSTRPTNGSCSGPVSASVTWPPRAK